MTTPNGFGERLRAARRARNWSQKQLAERCGWRNQSRISHYEAGRREPTRAEVELLAQALKCQPAELQFGVTTEAAPYSPALSRVPVVGSLNADPQATDTEEIVNLDYAWLNVPSNDPGAYSLVCLDNHYGRRVRAGELMLIEPGLTPQPGDEVIVRLHGERRVHYLEYVTTADGRVYFTDVANPAERIIHAATHIEYMHVVAGVFRPRAATRQR